MNDLVFEFPLGWQAGLPLVALGLWISMRTLRQQGLSRIQTALACVLRGGALAALALFISRPTWVSQQNPQRRPQHVALLVDASESMSLEESGRTRYQQALDYTRDRLAPALAAAGLTIHAFAFAEDARPADGTELAATQPRGRRTNLAGAIHQAVTRNAEPPLAVIALTDGQANVATDNPRGTAALLEHRVPFVGIALGTPMGNHTLSLRNVEAPATVATNTLFRISAQLELTAPEDIPSFDLVLLRNGRPTQRRTIQPGRGPRLWLESFTASEPAEGVQQFAVQLLAPSVPGLKCLETLGTSAVLITNERELRILYVQGALTWDYKFIGLALREDPSVRITGLVRTARNTFFRQNVESEEELKAGFPTRLDELAPYRVVVLASLGASDLTPTQQDLLAQFCSQLGGGLLLIGGPASLNRSWQGSRLEQILPATFSPNPGVLGLDPPFRIQPTEEALRHPVFQLASSPAECRLAWSRLPPFNHYARIDTLKPAAQAWILHPHDEGPQGPRILMASQRAGAGIAAILAIQNFWRWRLDRTSDPQLFDRFWRQLFRFLGEPSRQEVEITLADQDLRPEAEVRVSIEHKPQPGDPSGRRQGFRFQVMGPTNQSVLDQELELTQGRAVELTFRADSPGLYTLRVLGEHQVTVATRSLDIRDVSLEFRNTAMNLETLRQWALISGGLALTAQESPAPGDLVNHIRRRVEELQRVRPVRRPAAMNALSLAIIAGCLATEWLLRKHWKLT